MGVLSALQVYLREWRYLFLMRRTENKNNHSLGELQIKAFFIIKQMKASILEASKFINF